MLRVLPGTTAAGNLQQYEGFLATSYLARAARPRRTRRRRRGRPCPDCLGPSSTPSPALAWKPTCGAVGMSVVPRRPSSQADKRTSRQAGKPASTSVTGRVHVSTWDTVTTYGQGQTEQPSRSKVGEAETRVWNIVVRGRRGRLSHAYQVCLMFVPYVHAHVELKYCCCDRPSFVSGTVGTSASTDCSFDTRYSRNNNTAVQQYFNQEYRVQQQSVSSVNVLYQVSQPPSTTRTYLVRAYEYR